MTDAELRAFLEKLRDRRLAAARVYEASKVRAAREVAEKAQKQIAKQSDLLVREFKRIDNTLVKAEGRINKILALRMMVEQAPEAVGGES